jgi:ATP-binding cassette subfamily B protein/subfamily B ATP-binding cassette protein MsbA
LGSGSALFEGVSFALLFQAFSGLHSTPQVSFFLQSWLPIQGSGISFFIGCTLLAIAFQILRSGIGYGTTWVSTRIGCRLQVDLQRSIYRKILSMEYREVAAQSIGALIEIARSPAQFINPLLEGINRFVVSTLTSLAMVAMMWWLHASLTWISLGLFFLFGWLQKGLIRNILRSSDQFSHQLMALNQHTSQTLQGVKQIYLFSEQETVLSKVDTTVDEIGQASQRVYLLSNIIPYLNEMISVIVLGLVLLSALLVVGVEEMAFLPILMTFLLISYRLSTRVQTALGVLGSVGTYYGPIRRVYELFDRKDPVSPPRSSPESNKKLQAGLELRHVSFTYPSQTQQALSGINLCVDRCTMLGVVGTSGAGKTSLVDLILRLYEPDQGSLWIDGEPAQRWDLAAWRKLFGVVAQESFLFNETLEANIRFGKENLPFEQVEQAACLAHIHNWIQTLPSKYQTLVGEKGYRLSGGERQRVALARALIRKPQILILDEATSHLDSQTEKEIQDALEEIRKEITLIVIAHRLSTVRLADQIIVMEQGQIIERGTHEMLMTHSQGAYAHLWELQTRTTE